MTEWDRKAMAYERLVAAAAEVRLVAHKIDDRAPDEVSLIDELDRAISLAGLYTPVETRVTLAELSSRARRLEYVRRGNPLSDEVVTEAKAAFIETFDELLGNLHEDLH